MPIRPAEGVTLVGTLFALSPSTRVRSVTGVKNEGSGRVLVKIPSHVTVVAVVNVQALCAIAVPVPPNASKVAEIAKAARIARVTGATGMVWVRLVLFRRPFVCAFMSKPFMK
jgi:hypothetical protein